MRYLTLFLLVIVVACGKKKSSTTPPPAAANLLSPAQNEACLTTTDNKVQFSWSAANYAESYELTLIGLLDNSSNTYTTTSTTYELTLSANTPYAWYVTSKSSINPATTKSDSWKFYNSGSGISNYAPFPTELLTPGINQSVTADAGKITLTWSGSDPDGDTLSYDVYLGTNNANLSPLSANLSSSSLSNVSVISGTTYYWKVVAKDGNGNSSDSGIFSFTVN